MIPRFIYPNKSDMNITHWTAHRYGELSPNDEVTNVAPTYMGEFYMNFGFSGVLFGMFFVGMLASIVDKYVIGDRRSWTLPIMMFMILFGTATILVFLIIVLGGIHFCRRYDCCTKIKFCCLVCFTRCCKKKNKSVVNAANQK